MLTMTYQKPLASSERNDVRIERTTRLRTVSLMASEQRSARITQGRSELFLVLAASGGPDALVNVKDL